MLAKVFPIRLKDGNQAKAEAEELVQEYGKLSDLMVEFVEIDHELLVSL